MAHSKSINKPNTRSNKTNVNFSLHLNKIQKNNQNKIQKNYHIIKKVKYEIEYENDSNS